MGIRRDNKSRRKYRIGRTRRPLRQAAGERINGRLLCALADVAGTIRDGDLLLFRRRGAIAIAGRGVHSHAAKAIWWGSDLMCVEVREWHGGRAVLLRREVDRRPGLIDVYETNPDDRWPGYQQTLAAQYMRRLAGCGYSYWGIVQAACLHLPIVRWCVKPSVDDFDADSATNRPVFCSQAVAMADRIAGGVDPVEGLSDRITEPADLARSKFYRYRFSLLP